jgi:hypothetical protein
MKLTFLLRTVFFHHLRSQDQDNRFSVVTGGPAMAIRPCLITTLFVTVLGMPARVDSAESVERWLFLGRRTESGWNPPSISTSAPAYPVQPGSRVLVKRHALAYGSVDCTILDAADFKANEQVAPAVEFVRAGEEGLEISGSPIECPSVCGAKTVWVNVRVPAARLVTIDP